MYLVIYIFILPIVLQYNATDLIWQDKEINWETEINREMEINRDIEGLVLNPVEVPVENYDVVTNQ